MRRFECLFRWLAVSIVLGDELNVSVCLQLPEEEVVAQIVVGVPRGSGVTVVHQDVPSIEEEGPHNSHMSATKSGPEARHEQDYR